MKKTILGSLKDATGTVVGYIQYKNEKEVEVWVSEEYQKKHIQISHVRDKKEKRNINGQVVEARRKTIPIESLQSPYLPGLTFVEFHKARKKHGKLLDNIKQSLDLKTKPDEKIVPSGDSTSIKSYEILEVKKPEDDRVYEKPMAGNTPPPPLPTESQQDKEKRLQKEAAAKAEALATKQRTEDWRAAQTKEQEGIYQNVETVLQEAKKKLEQASSKASELIAFRAAGSYGMVLEVKTTDGKVVAKKIEIPNADNIKSFESNDQKMILEAFIGKLISYEEFKGFLEQAGPDYNPNPGAIAKIMKTVKERVDQRVVITTPSEASSPELSDEEKTLLIFNGEGGKYFPHVYSRDQSLNSYDMDYFEKGSLKKHLSQEIPIADRLKMISSLSDCASFMLSHNLIHNDLHAGNILVRDDSSLVIADPGKVRFIAAGKEGALFEVEPRQLYLMHPDYINHYYSGENLAGLEDRSVDTMYNDAWSESLLIGAILNPRLLGPSPPDGEGYEIKIRRNTNEIYDINRDKVIAAIQSCEFLKDEEREQLKEDIRLLTPTEIPKMTSSEAVYEQRKVLSDALTRIGKTMDAAAERMSAIQRSEITAKPEKPVASLVPKPLLVSHSQPSEKKPEMLSKKEIQKVIQGVFDTKVNPRDPSGFSPGFSDRCADALIALEQSTGKQIDVRDLLDVMIKMVDLMADKIANQYQKTAQKEFDAKSSNRTLSAGENVETIKKALAKQDILSKEKSIVSALDTKKTAVKTSQTRNSKR